MAFHPMDDIVVNVSQFTREKATDLKVTEIIQPESDKLFVLLPPWHVWSGLWARLQKRLLKQGYSILAYEVSEDVLSADGRQVAARFDEVKDAAVKRIKELQGSENIKKIDVLGLSLGTASALHIATSGVEIDNLILVSPSADLPEGIYFGTRTKKIRRQLDKINKSLEEYRAEMPQLTMRKKFKMDTKNVQIILSDADKVIPYKLGLELVDILRSHGIKTTIHRRPLRGHYFTFILYCLRGAT